MSMACLNTVLGYLMGGFRVQGERQGSWVATGFPPHADAMLAAEGIDRAQRMINALTIEVGS